jgi:hypothetical protein
MGDPDVFDDLLASLGGFYRSWLIYLGIELGLFEALRHAGRAGLTPAELATATDTHAEAVDLWAWAADAHQLAELEGGRLRVDADLSGTLLDRERTDYLGGQFIHGLLPPSTGTACWNSSARERRSANAPTATGPRSSG